MSQQRGYKRSWKNLLINKRYQLRFTLFMAGLAAVLMTALGWWVIRVADEATTVAKSRARGTVCPPSAAQAAAKAAEAAAAVRAPAAPALVAPAPPKADPVAGEPAAGDPTADDADRKVQLDESSMTLTEEVAPPPPPGPPPPSAEEQARMNAAHAACEASIDRKLDAIEHNRSMIVLVLIVSGVLLTVGLALFGIKMTHKVAGPLHKVTLYLAKLRDGRYDKVYDLRKGDQLVEFYEHFKHAHAGVVTMEQADVERIKAALDAAVADGVLDRSPEAKTAAAALRTVLERKEASLG